jgi:hypothetical protein
VQQLDAPYICSKIQYQVMSKIKLMVLEVMHGLDQLELSASEVGGWGHDGALYHTDFLITAFLLC